MKVQDLTTGNDIRGDYALFIEEKHFINGGWSIDQKTKNVVGNDIHFFRVIRNGEQQGGHGWIENGEIIQWG